MNDPETQEKVIAAFLTVPEKKLLIIQLANEIPLKDGELDPVELLKKQPEINLAIAEAKNYGAHTLQAVDHLIRLRERRGD